MERVSHPAATSRRASSQLRSARREVETLTALGFSEEEVWAWESKLGPGSQNIQFPSRMAVAFVLGGYNCSFVYAVFSMAETKQVRIVWCGVVLDVSFVSLELSVGATSCST